MGPGETAGTESLNGTIPSLRRCVHGKKTGRPATLLKRSGKGFSMCSLRVLIFRHQNMHTRRSYSLRISFSPSIIVSSSPGFNRPIFLPIRSTERVRTWVVSQLAPAPWQDSSRPRRYRLLVFGPPAHLFCESLFCKGLFEIRV
jgi:hypothetical protein